MRVRRPINMLTTPLHGVWLVLPYIAAVGCTPAGQEAAPPATPTAAAPPDSPPSVAAALLKPLKVEPSSHNLIKRSSFADGKSLPWTMSFSAPATGDTVVDSGVYCLKVTDKGKNNWDAQIRHREMTIQKGHKYTVRLKISSTRPTEVLIKAGMSGPPYKTYWQTQAELGTEGKVIKSEFTMEEADDPTAEFAFHMGGDLAPKVGPYTVCVDQVVLEDPTFKPKEETPPPPVPNVLVNQRGYLPGLAKIAIVKSESTSPLDWALVSASGAVVASGKTTVAGPDQASGDKVHRADFSAFSRTGTGFKVRVGKDESHPFDITGDLYKKLKYDALAYFYHNRSGIEIAMPFAGDAKWARPAGHLGDKSVPCAPEAKCSYSLDVSGGWYDAGDHGKYVVNGGISVWTMLNEYERAKHLGTSVGDFGDGKLNIPENKNGVPDILDEARWELDFLMKMQVPEGKPMVGMVHHKMHNKEWTALGTPPDKDTVARFLRPVSTAATLNVAAATAQGARIWKTIDPTFSTRCLQAAERAWAAATANPAVLALASDGMGGGAYEDNDVKDEFYWAASELFVTTGKAVYRDFLTKSPLFKTVPATVGGQATAFTWQSVGALGTISLAVVPNALPPADVAASRAAVTKAADSFLAADSSEGYVVPFQPTEKKFPWGSNSFVANNAIVLALAMDISKDAKYLKGVEDAMDYLLGRNPMDQSYVSGYGFRPLANPHHRFWSHQANAAFPPAPPGALSGGPNSDIQDPYAKASGLAGCAPMKCFVDNIEAWSTNEITINWNAPLAWVAAFLDEQATKAQGPSAKAAPVKSAPVKAEPAAPKAEKPKH